MKSERLLAFYENVREQVQSDVRVGGLYRFADEGVKQYAEELRKEIVRRQLPVKPIDWRD
jgi:hypothetical protein